MGGGNDVELCKLCRRSLPKRGHVYSKTHRDTLTKIFAKFSARLAPAFKAVDKPTLALHGSGGGKGVEGSHSSRQREQGAGQARRKEEEKAEEPEDCTFWCYFCELELPVHTVPSRGARDDGPGKSVVDEPMAKFAFSGMIVHLASEAHGERARDFFRRHCIRDREVGAFLISHQQLGIFKATCESALAAAKASAATSLSSLQGASGGEATRDSAERGAEQFREQGALLGAHKRVPWDSVPVLRVPRGAVDGDENAVGEWTASGEGAGEKRRRVDGAAGDDVGTANNAEGMVSDSSSAVTGVSFGIGGLAKTKKKTSKADRYPHRVGADFDRSQPFPDDWLPNFGSVWEEGARAETKRKFLAWWATRERELAARKERKVRNGEDSAAARNEGVEERGGSMDGDGRDGPYKKLERSETKTSIQPPLIGPVLPEGLATQHAAAAVDESTYAGPQLSASDAQRTTVHVSPINRSPLPTTSHSELSSSPVSLPVSHPHNQQQQQPLAGPLLISSASSGPSLPTLSRPQLPTSLLPFPTSLPAFSSNSNLISSHSPFSSSFSHAQLIAPPPPPLPQPLLPTPLPPPPFFLPSSSFSSSCSMQSAQPTLYLPQSSLFPPPSFLYQPSYSHQPRFPIPSITSYTSPQFFSTPSSLGSSSHHTSLVYSLPPLPPPPTPPLPQPVTHSPLAPSPLNPSSNRPVLVSSQPMLISSATTSATIIASSSSTTITPSTNTATAATPISANPIVTTATTTATLPTTTVGAITSAASTSLLAKKQALMALMMKKDQGSGR